jgi:hypothetical protein
LPRCGFWRKCRRAGAHHRPDTEQARKARQRDCGRQGYHRKALQRDPHHPARAHYAQQSRANQDGVEGGAKLSRRPFATPVELLPPLKDAGSG